MVLGGKNVGIFIRWKNAAFLRYLNVLLSLHEKHNCINFFKITLYIKSTNHQQYLYFSSCHPPQTTPGSLPCCKTCPIHPSSLSFTNPVTKLTYPIGTHATCSSNNFIYHLTCTWYDSFYAGKTKNSCPLE